MANIVMTLSPITLLPNT